MKTIVFISCSSKKLPHKAKAKDLYISPLFQKSLEFAYSLNPDNIFILSAKHGLVSLEQKLEPYNETLNKMTTLENKKWAKVVEKQLRGEVNSSDKVIFLAGKKYRRHFEKLFKKLEVPMEGLSIGKQLQYLNNKIGYAK